jgi:Holliday junction DNA helicase RuvA
MIANISGRVTEVGSDRIVLEVGGVGLWVYVPEPLCETLRKGETISLYTHLAVREDSLTLYGFAVAEERQYFELLLGVNGIGPRLAVAALAALDPATIRRAVFAEQHEVFTRVPGIGPRTAQKMLLYLQGRIEAAEDFEHMASMPETDTQVVEALVALGYSVVEAQAALQSIPSDAPEDVEERIKLALQYFV